MKKNILLTFILIVVNGTAFSQTPHKRWYVEAYARPLLRNLGNFDFEEKGIGYHYIYAERASTYELGGNVGIRVYKGLSLGVGYSHKVFEHTLMRFATNLYIPYSQTEKVSRQSLRYPAYGLRLNAKYTFSKAYVELNLDYSLPYSYKIMWNGQEMGFRHRQETVWFSSPYEQKEIVTALEDANTYDWVIPEIVAGYKLKEGLYLQGALKCKWYGKKDVLNWKYTGNIPGNTTGNPILNDVHLYNRYVMYSFGLSYQFWWGKGRRSK